MSTADNTYGTVERVEARIGDLVSGRQFGNTTTPTRNQVETILDDVAMQLNAELRANGYTVPVPNSGTDVEAFGWLRAANSAGAAAMVLNMLPGGVLDPETPDENLNRRRGLWAEMNAVLKAIQKGDFPATRTVTRELTKAWAGSQEDEDGNEREPVFKRELTSWPGVW